MLEVDMKIWGETFPSQAFPGRPGRVAERYAELLPAETDPALLPAHVQIDG